MRAPSILPHSTNLLGPLGRLSLRPLQYHLHLLGLTIRFISPRRSDPLVLAILPLWQDLRFLISGIPILSADLTIFMLPLPWGEACSWGIPRYRVPGPIQTQAIGCLDPSKRKLHISCLELKAVMLRLPCNTGPQCSRAPGYDRYGLFDSFLGQQTRRDTLSHLVTFNSRASPLVRGSERYSPSKTFSRLSERDSRPPISSEAANSDRVVPTPRDSSSYLQGLGDTRDRHVCHSVELPPTTAHVSNSGPTSHSGRRSVASLAGEVNVGQCTCFPPFSLLNRVFKKEPLRWQR